MFVKLGFVLSFFRDLFFKDSDEMNIKSSKFNTIRMMVFLFIVMIVSMDAFLINRVFTLGTRITQMKAEAELCKDKTLPAPVVPKTPLTKPSP